jgi:hypothetical protein
MLKPRLLIKPTTEATRLLLTHGEDEILRAALPPATQLHSRAAPTLLEALALWYQRPVCAVVCASDLELSSGLSLCDGFGFGARTVHYEVEVVDLTRLRRRGMGSFRDLRQLALRGVR